MPSSQPCGEFGRGLPGGVWRDRHAACFRTGRQCLRGALELGGVGGGEFTLAEGGGQRLRARMASRAQVGIATGIDLFGVADHDERDGRGVRGARRGHGAAGKRERQCDAGKESSHAAEHTASPAPVPSTGHVPH